MDYTSNLCLLMRCTRSYDQTAGLPTVTDIHQQAQQLHGRMRGEPGFLGIVYTPRGLLVRVEDTAAARFRGLLQPSFKQAPAGQRAFTITVAAIVAPEELVKMLNANGWTCTLLGIQPKGQKQVIRVAASTPLGFTDVQLQLGKQTLYAVVEPEDDPRALSAEPRRLPHQHLAPLLLRLRQGASPAPLPASQQRWRLQLKLNAKLNQSGLLPDRLLKVLLAKPETI